MDPDGSFNDWDLLILVEEAIQWCVTIRCCMPWVLRPFFLDDLLLALLLLVL